MTLPLTLIA